MSDFLYEPDIEQILKCANATRGDLALALNVSVQTVHKWIWKDRRPSRTVVMLLHMIQEDPRVLGRLQTHSKVVRKRVEDTKKPAK